MPVAYRARPKSGGFDGSGDVWLNHVKADRLFDIRNRIALITGGAAGIGRAYAEAMVDNGADVAIIDINPESLETAAKQLRGSGRRVESVVADVADRPALRQAIEEIIQKFGRVDICFANAGIPAGSGFLTPDGQRSVEGALENVPDELWDKVLATNLTSVVTTVQGVVPSMKATGSGRIIVTASISGQRPGAAVGSPYIVSKAAVLHFVKQTALELAKFRITVNAIVPGTFLTSITSPGLREMFERNSLMHRVAQTEEIQGLALFLASAASSYVTGAHMVIDGGSTLGRSD